MRIAVKNQAGEILEPLELNDAVFNVPMNRSLVHQAMVIYQANKRQGTHDTKTRAEVSGGGRKPWIQKHTGRARQGSTRSPQWRHGGVVFGPLPREYRKALPRRMRRLALRCVLSEKAREDRLVCLDATDTLNGKTKSVVDLLQNLEVAGSALVVTVGTDQNLVFAANNLKKVWTLPVTQLNAEEVLSRETVIMTVEAARWAEESLALEPHGRRGVKQTISGEAAAVVEPSVDDTPAGEEAPAPRRRRRTTVIAAAETADESAEPARGETAEAMGTDTPEVAEAEPVKPPVRRRRRTAVSTDATGESVAEEPEAAAGTAEEDLDEISPKISPEEEE